MLIIKTFITGLVLVLFFNSSFAANTFTQTQTMTTTQTFTTTTSSTVTTTIAGPKSAHGTFIFDPKTRLWSAYAPDGSLVRSGYGSGGSNYCRDLHRRCHTPVGHFYVYDKGDAGCKSSKFPIDHPGAPMPWCMYFHGGFAIHGSYEVRSYNASHGCIRITPMDADWLSHHLIQIGTLVIVEPY